MRDVEFISSLPAVPGDTDVTTIRIFTPDVRVKAFGGYAVAVAAYPATFPVTVVVSNLSIGLHKRAGRSVEYVLYIADYDVFKTPDVDGIVNTFV